MSSSSTTLAAKTEEFVVTHVLLLDFRGVLTVHLGQSVGQLVDFYIQGVVTNVELVDHLVHTGKSGHWERQKTRTHLIFMDVC